MKFAITRNTEKIVRDNFEFLNLGDNEFALIIRDKDKLVEFVTLNKNEWKIIWEMLTEK